MTEAEDRYLLTGTGDCPQATEDEYLSDHAEYDLYCERAKGTPLPFNMWQAAQYDDEPADPDPFGSFDYDFRNENQV